MESERARAIAGPVTLTAALLLACALTCDAGAAPPDFSGVWGMVQHDRLGAPFFIPIEPKLNDAGKAATDAFKAKYDVAHHEANGACVEPGMPTVMWGIGGATSRRSTVLRHSRRRSDPRAWRTSCARAPGSSTRSSRACFRACRI